MKHRYTVQTAQEDDRVLIREEAELDKDLYSTQCSVSFHQDILRDAMGQGVFSAIQLIRSKDFYPTLSVAERIVEAIRLFFEDSSQPVAIEIDDTDFITKRPKPAPIADADVEEDSGDLDDLLDDDEEDAFDDDFGLDDVNPSLKIADDDTVDVDEGQ